MRGLYKNILVIQTAYLGDLIWTTPLIKTLSCISEHKTVDVLCIPTTGDCINGLPFVDKLIVHHKKNLHRGIFNIHKTINDIARGNYDLIVSPHLSLRSSLFSLVSGATVKCGFEEAVLSSVYDLKVPYDKSLHFVDRFLELAKPLGINDPHREMTVAYDSESEEYAETIHKELGDFIAILPGSNWHTKIYPPPYYNKLSTKINRKLGHPVVILGKKDEEWLGRAILNEGVEGLNLCGRTTLKGLASILRRAEVVIGGDSGGMHIAEAVYARTLFLYGATSPEYGIGPIQGEFRVLQSQMKCSPCSEHGTNRCPLGYEYCMMDLEPDIVFSELLKLSGER